MLKTLSAVVGDQRMIVNEIMRRKKNWIEHLLKEEGSLRGVTEGRMVGVRPRGRKRTGILSELKQERSFEKLKRMAQHRRLWRVAQR